MSNEIKKAVDDIELPEGAEERMYANILKKASEQKKPDIKMYKGICLAAACAAVVIVSAAVVKNNGSSEIAVGETTISEETADSEPLSETGETNPAVGGGLEGGLMAGNPFAEEYTLDDIIAAGYDITLPENARTENCILWDGSGADVRFTLNGHLYYYSVSDSDGDLSGIYGDVAESSDISENAVLDVTSEGYFKAHWSGGKYNYYFCNTDGADREEFINTALFMAKQAE